MPRNTASTDTLLTLLDKATNKNLAKVRRQITDLRKQLDKLVALEGLLAVKLRNKPKFGPMSGPAIASGLIGNDGRPVNEQMRCARHKIAEYLCHAGIPVKRTVLAQMCGIPEGSMTKILDCPWFERTTDGVALTEAGRKMN